MSKRKHKAKRLKFGKRKFKVDRKKIAVIAPKAVQATPKATRKPVSPIDAAYGSFSRMWSKAFGKDSIRMSKEEFLMDADMRGIDLSSKEALLRAARQRVASAGHQLTTEQAKNLKRSLLNLSDADLRAIGFSRDDAKSMTIEAYKALPTTEGGKGMISKFYELLKQQGLTAQEANEWISGDIFGSP